MKLSSKLNISFDYIDKVISNWNERNLRTKEDINIPQTCDVNNIILLAKLHYLRQISYSNENYNSPEKIARANEHMHENISRCKFNDEDVLNYVDEFLIFSGKCRGVEIDKVDLKRVEEYFKLEQNSKEK